MHSPTSTSTPTTSPLTAGARRRRTVAAATLATGVTLGLLATAALSAASPAVAARAAEPAASATSGAAYATYPSGIETLHDIAADAETALSAARAAVNGAAAVTEEVEASGFDFDGMRTSIDTTALQDEVDRLATHGILPLMLVPDATDDTVAQTRLVMLRIGELREALDAAVAKKAAEEAAAAAAAKAAAEAAAQAKREAEAAAAALAAVNTVEGAKATAANMASANYGWGGDQFSCLESLWNKESGWNYQAYNGSSGATGIPQALPGSKMASAGSDWQTNAATQIAWGLGYISAVYGSPCAAWGHSQATNWY
ncbi:phospholipase [Microbacterium sp. 2FI]|uniref:aggregation-promoting factor C-terminal-like domain-containing protein n=1 Tax=Microbacterium sp. 2FI TaxID=2502193 RepID=UPI0010F76730|nr:phospholipase [Microbacterium sp. 2FI]